MMFSILGDQLLFYQTVFLFFQIEQAIAVADSYFLRMFSLFSILFFSFLDDKLLLWLLEFALINGGSGCLWFLGTQPHSKGASCSPQGCLHGPSLQASGSQSGRHFFSVSIFPIKTRLSLWLLPSATQALWSRKITALGDFLGYLNAHPEEEEVEKMS